jgi:hypothetical protein
MLEFSPYPTTLPTAIFANTIQVLFVMASYQKLPNEMIDQIILCLDSVSDRHTLLDLCLTSKASRITAQPVLFSKFSFEGERVERKRDELTRIFFFHSPSKEQLLLFTRSVILRPDLALQVKDLSIAVCEEDLSDKATWNASTSEVDMEIFITAARAVRIPTRVEWIYELRKKKLEAFLALLVLQVINIDRFSLKRGIEPLHNLLNVAFHVVNSPNGTQQCRALSSLKELCVSVVSVSSGLLLNDIGFLMLLPTLRKVRLEQALRNSSGIAHHVPGPSVWRPDELPHYRPKTSTLDILNSSMDSVALDGLLALCSDLRHLGFHITKDAPRGSDPAWPAEITGLLVRFPTVVDLHLDFSDTDYYKQQQTEPDTNFASSLLQLTTLKRLTLDMATLPSEEAIPGAVEFLAITHCDRDVTGFLTLLALRKRTSLRALTRVRVAPLHHHLYEVFGLFWEEDNRSSFDHAVTNLRVKLAEVGIEFEVDLGETSINSILSSRQQARQTWEEFTVNGSNQSV